MLSYKKKLQYLFMVSPVILFLDLWTKSLIVKNLQIGDKLIVWEGFFDIVHVRNFGAAFGIFSSWDSPYRNLFFYVLFTLAFIFLFSFLKEVHNKKMVFALASIFGGALGNLIDRIYRGSVVDFLSVHWKNAVWDFNLFGERFYLPLVWPSFNVADMAISLGVISLLIFLSLDKKQKGKVILADDL